MDKKQDQWSITLRECGLKRTSARTSILDTLAAAEKPMTVEEIGERIHREKIDMVTLYRALKQLTNARLVRYIDFHHGHAHYELNDPKKDHHHIICTKCHMIEDFKGCDFSDLVKRVLAQTKNFRTVSEHSLELFGLCKKCEKK